MKLTTIDNHQSKQTQRLRDRLFKGIFWNLIGVIASRGSSLIAAIIVARVLGASEYGELGIIQSTIGMFGTFAGMGLGVTCTRFIAELKHDDPERVGRIIALTHMVGWISASLLALTLIILAPWLAHNTLGNPELTFGLRLSSLLLLFSSITGLQGGTLAGFEAFKSMARIGIIQGICSFPLIIGGVYCAGVEGAIVGLGLSSVFGYLLNIRTIAIIARETSIRPCYRTAWSEKMILKQTAIPSMLTGVMVGPIVWCGNAIIVNQPGGYTALGIFNAVNQWKILLTYLPSVVGGVLLPMLSATANKQNSRLEAFNILANWLFVCAIGLVFMAVPEIISIFYGNAYAGSEFNVCLSLMMMVSIILAFKEGIARKLVVGNLLWWGALSNLLWAAGFLAFVYLFRSKGAPGLAFAYLISYIINTFIFLPFYIRRGVVSKEFFFSKEILFAWIAIVSVLVISFSTEALYLRIPGLILAGLVIFGTMRHFNRTSLA